MVTGNLIVICTLFHTLLSAQDFTIQGKIISTETHQPVDFANVIFIDPITHRTFGTISDTEGAFTLSLPVDFAADTLQISFVGFESRKIPLTEFQKGELRIIKLQPSVTYLSSIIVRDLSAEEFFLKCISKIRDNYLDAAFINQCFYWQSEREDETYRSLNHAYLTIREKIEQDKFNRTVTKDSSFLLGITYKLHFLESVDNIFYFDFLRAGTSFLKKEYLKEWTITFDHKLSLPDSYVVIDAVRLDKFTRLRFLINDSDYAIEQVDYWYKWKDVDQPLNDSLHYKMGALQGKVVYKKNAAHYNLKYITNEFSFVAIEKLTNKKLFTRTVQNEIVTYSSQKLQPGTLPMSEENKIQLPREFVVVNKEAYRDAVRNIVE